MTEAEADYALWQELGRLLYKDESRQFSRVMNILSNLAANAIAMHPQSEQLLEAFIDDVREKVVEWRKENQAQGVQLEWFLQYQGEDGSWTTAEAFPDREQAQSRLQALQGSTLHYRVVDAAQLKQVH